MLDPAPDALLDRLIDVALDAAGRAGALLLEGIDRVRASVGTKSTGTDMVTEMDHAAEASILATLAAARPDDAVLAEEGGTRPGTTGVRWIVDPLDGTTNYLYRHPRWAVSIAAEVAGRVVVAVVADPSAGEVFSAVQGRGAFCNGSAIRHSGATDVSRALVATGFSYDAALRATQGEVVARLLPRVRDIRRQGAAALDLCWLATGRVDAYYEGPLQQWDVAAGNLIAAEAGAFVATLDLLAPGSHSALAAAPGVAEAFVTLLAEVGGPVDLARALTLAGAVDDQEIRPGGAAANLVPDAHPAALAVEHGAGLYSFDRDLDRFSDVRWPEPGPTT